MAELFGGSLDEIERTIKQSYARCADIKINRMRGVRTDCLIVYCDGLLDIAKCYKLLVKPIKRLLKNPFLTSTGLMRHLIGNHDATFDVVKQSSLNDTMHAVMSGAAAVIAADVPYAVCLGLPGYSYRAVSDSFTEQNVRAPREGFTEPLKINQTLIRRRLKTNELVFESFKIGTLSRTDVCMVYLKSSADAEMLQGVRKRLASIRMETLLESGSIEPFLAKQHSGLISGVGHTERPDVLCAKLREGKIGILVDGTPFAIVLPHLFLENFQNVDDYSGREYYANFMRLLRFCAFFISSLLPGIYVSVVSFNPELIPSTLLFNIASSEYNTPLPIMLEAVFIHFVYELVREAGLRLPQPVGHSVSLIGALVVGDAAVNAGIVSSSMVMVIAFAAVCSYTVPSLYEQIAVLRPIFILLGGMLGPFGIVAGISFTALDLLGTDSYGLPFASPAVPFSSLLFRDALFRASWRKLEGEDVTLRDYLKTEMRSSENGK